jgi:alpha-L-arabinofuranosidase
LLTTPVKITVDPDRVLNRITPRMYGSCIEDVNHEIYGGLYAQRIFGESFEEPPANATPAGWRMYGGRWFPEGDGIHVRAGNGPKLVREMPDMTDGTVEARLAISNDMTENAGLLVRVSYPGLGPDSFDGYEVSFAAKARQIVLGKHRNDFQSLQTVPAPLVPGRWHRLRVTLNGPRIRVYLDDETAPRIDFTDSNRPLLSGKIALRTWHSNVSFRDVRIDGKPTPLGFEGTGISAMWDAVRTGGVAARFAREGNAFNGALCQKIEHGGGAGQVGVANRGLNRWGIAVRKGRPMEGRIYLRGDVGTATVALQSADGRRTYAIQRVPVGGNWTKAPFRLNPKATDPKARFTVTIDRKGSLWMDQAVLMDGDPYKGLPFRGDIAQMLEKGGLTFLRYGGTMINTPAYRWKDMIGDPDRRPPHIGHWNPVSTHGFGIFEFLRFCEAAKIEAAFAINPEETPEDAADLADYLTAPANTEWGRKRAADGHREPYRFVYLQIGNEEAIANPSVEAMSHYASRFRLLAKAIHGRNPNIKLVCGAWWVPDAPEAMKTVFDAVDGVAAAWDFHFWSDDANSGAGIDRELARAQAMFKAWNPTTPLKAVVFEENGNRHDMQRALGHGTTINATRRHGDFVLVDCAANCLQPWKQNDNGWDQGQVFFTTDHAWGMPPYDAQRMLSADHLPLRVFSSAEGLDVLATRSEDGRSLVLTVVNTTDKPVASSVALGSFAARSGRARTMSGRPGMANPPYGPKAVVPKESALEVKNGQASLEIPAYALMSIRFERSK